MSNAHKDDDAIADIREHLAVIHNHIADITLGAGDEMGPEVDGAIKQLSDAADELERALDFIQDKDKIEGTKLTAQQVINLIPETYPAFMAGIQDMPKELAVEEFGTAEPDEIWEACSFELKTDGRLFCHQNNDITMVWNPSSDSWDDLEEE